MTIEIFVVLALVVVAILMFATEKLPVDMVALLVLATLLVSGIITPAEGLSGFSNPAAVTVGAMFILSAALFKTGAVNIVGEVLTRIGKRSFWLAITTIMVFTGAISAFINNTAAVAILMPIVLGAARDLRVSASKLLMPLSFASMFGGICTLIGTSTNILINSIAREHGQPAFTMFEFSALGIIFFMAGTVYMLALGVRLIPARRLETELTQKFRMDDYLTEIVLLPEAESVGKSLSDASLVRDLDIAILSVQRNQERLIIPPPDTVLQANDVLRVRCNVEKIKKLQKRQGVALKAGLKWRDKDLETDEAMLVEAVVAPNSVLEGRTLREVQFRNTFDAIVLALRHRGTVMRENVGRTRLRAGDTLLIEVRKTDLNRLQQHPAFVIVSKVGLQEFRKDKIAPALLILIAVVGAAALDIFPIVVSAIAGCVLMLLTRCITLEETYQAIEWSVLFLLAGVLSLGVALEKTGAARLISEGLLTLVGGWGPVAVCSALFLLTMMFTNFISNNATAVLIAPIAIFAAESMGVSTRPFLVAVTFSASLSFMTPVGYQTNTLIYGPGQYKFADFMRVGTPLNLLFWAMGTVLIPIFWPF